MKMAGARIKDYLELAYAYPFNALALKTGSKIRSKLKRRKKRNLVNPNKHVAMQDPAFNVDYRGVIELVAGSYLEHIIRQGAEEAGLHLFDRLGSGLVKVKEANLRRSEQLKTEIKFLKDYELIDWHVDFKSGYRWNPEVIYEHIPADRLSGADVKVPWELSRFHQATDLGLAHLLDNANPRWVREFMLQTTDWVLANPYPYGVNWCCTMDVAIRAINWLWGLVLFKDSAGLCDSFKALVTRSLYQHGYHIEHNLEFLKRGFHGNHYLSNLAGLIYIGAFLPGFEESDRWLAFGLQEIVEEIKYQVYDDGVCFEDSTAYHCLAAEIFFSSTAVVLNLPQARRHRLKGYVNSEHRVKPCLQPYSKQEYNLESAKIFPEWYYAKLEGMADFILDITKSNGRVPQFGDNDSGRLHKFTPVIDERGEKDINDCRYILAVAGKLFGRDDFLESGAPYKLDAELLLGQVDGLPIRSENRGKTALYRRNRAQAGRKRQECLTTETIISVGKSFNQNHKETKKHSFVKLFYYKDSGIAIYKSDLYYFAITCGSNGLGGIGAHSHNDKLSFEMNVLGCDFIVDGGSYLYTPDWKLRNAFRSTRAHNTVLVEGKEQNEILPGHLFVLPDRSKAEILEATETNFLGNHQGYGFMHTREVYFKPDQISIIDYLEKSVPAYFILNLNPDVEIQTGIEEDLVLLKNKDIVLKIAGRNIKKSTIQPGYYSVKYGKRVANNRLVVPIC